MYIADLHIHSRYSRATSRECTPEHLELWARRKGIHIVGTGDFTHPAWREELKEKLTPAEDGLYVLKEEYRISDGITPDTFLPRFVITGEISSIYKKNDRVRKVHSLILLPGLEAAEVVSKKLELIGNIHSDGRPILGLDCHSLLEILLELCPESVYVPAHIWTPHFSLFGAFSGFDTVEECFEDLSPYIHAMETGLSSDPPMIWRVSALDKYQLISNSDAHSPAKLGREANLLDIALSYAGLREAIQTGKGLYGTIEFFPEEGKYHMDGHRKCNLCLTPQETLKYNNKCPVCGKKITIGVSHRIEQLADRDEGFVRKNAKAFESLVPLPEVIGASMGRSAESRAVQKEYQNLLLRLGPEFEILRTIPTEEIQRVTGSRIAEGISRLRAGEVERIPGFDGEYGTIHLFREEELASAEGQMDFFSMLGVGLEEKKKAEIVREIAVSARETAVEESVPPVPESESVPGTPSVSATAELNPLQDEAVRAVDRRIAVIAGPGTGKTKTLISHLLYLLRNRKVKPGEITAVTFTNQAAAEMRERLQKQLGSRRRLQSMQIGTFHAICLSVLKAHGLEFSLLDEAEALEKARWVIEESGLTVKPQVFLEQLSRLKSGVEQYEDEKLQKAFGLYQEILKNSRQMDFDDLLLETVKLMEHGDAQTKKPFAYLLVDEFQDINPLQYRLMKAWNDGGRELFVIGDPDQSIYGFRGADSGCFARLSQEFGEVRIVRLVENYRSAPEILNAALEVISHNPGEARTLHANRETCAPVRLVKAGSEMGEAIFVAKEISRMAGGIGMLEAHEAAETMEHRKIRGFGEIAVLYRTHRQGEILEKCLRQEGIPYVVAGRESFLADETVRASLGFFRYLENPAALPERGTCLRTLWNLDENEISMAVMDGMAEKLRPAFQKKKPQKFLELWMQEMQLEENSAMKKLAGMTVFYQTMPEFLTALCLGVESDLKRCGGRHYTSETVTLMTLHGSKGLEFPVTFVYGVRGGMIPYENEKHPADKEEERRLFYVGMTRAKEELILTTSGEDSEFVTDLPDETIQREDESRRRKRESCRQMSLFDYMS